MKKTIKIKLPSKEKVKPELVIDRSELLALAGVADPEALDKAVQDAYKGGYGQAKADMGALVNEALASVADAFFDLEQSDLDKESRKALRKVFEIRMQEIRRIRSLMKALK